MRIEASHLGKSFTIGARKLEVLHDLNVTVERGRFVCLLGPSGCGKSTFLRCIAGLETPTSGNLLIDGKPAGAPGPDRSMVFQDYALFPWYSVAENVLFGLKLRRNRERLRGTADTKLRSLLALVGLTGFEHAYPHQISGGMRQRVGLARALAVDPGALLMDEPFAAIDAITREGLQRELVDVWMKTGITIVFVTHSVDEATFLADEVHVFGTRPASIRYSCSVDLPRPRQSASPRFQEIAATLRNSIDEGMRSARGRAA
jgi:ABC-type nitrate/sulfonate/bicarbonate transport system ATPase subunit